MARTHDVEPIITALEIIVAAVEGDPARLRFATNQLIFDFAVDSPVLLAEHERILDDLREYVTVNPEATIIAIVGRASQTGPDSNNDALAFDRAETVRAHLLATGLPESRIGPTVAAGSSRPLINVPGREAAVNRSVELLLDWEHVPTPPPAPSGIGATRWRLELAMTFGGSAGIGGQIQVGRLFKLGPGQREVSRAVTAWIAGADVAKSVGPVAAYDAPIPSPIDEEGVFTTAAAVDFDWFDGRLMFVASAGGSAIIGAAVTMITIFDSDGLWPQMFYIDHPFGFTFGIGASVMVGILNVFDQ
jgi:hypothetical protein